MSNNKIDNRIVEMSFENKSFEKGISDSTKSLADFDKALKNSGNGSSFSGLSGIVSGVSEKFSALETIAVGALLKIGSQLTVAGQQFINAFAIAPIGAGFDEYELKINSIKTMLASGKDEFGDPVGLEEVNRQLEVLNAYADQTIYSFSDMTSNIGKFTNAGVPLNDSVAAIKGIANAAALAGSSSSDASRAMYNFAQALSAGYVKLIDWKSIENANMATVEFKTQLLESAVAAGTLEKQADGMYKVLSSGDVISATQGFNDSLQTQWMTTEALTKTLADYADETTVIGKKATEAATKVRTFTQVIEVTKESLQSGWAQSFELIFGDFDQATELWTGLSNVISGFVQNTSDSRNAILKLWADMGGRNYIIEGISIAWKNLTSIVGKVKDVFKDIIPSQVKMGATLVKISRKFRDFMAALTPTEKTLDTIKIVFRGLFDILSVGFKIAKSVFGGLASGIKKVVDSLPIGNGLLGFLSNFGSFLSGVKNYAEGANIFETISSTIANAITWLADKIKDAVKFVKESTLIYDIIEKIKTVFSDFNIDFTLFNQFIDFLKSLKDALFGTFDNINIFGASLNSGVSEPMKVLGKSIKPMDDVLLKLRRFIDTIKDKLQPAIDFMKKVFKSLGDFFAKTWETEGLDGVLSIIRTLVAADVGKGLKDLFGALTGLTKDTGEAIGGVTSIFGEIRDVLKSYQESLDSKKIISIAIAVGILAVSFAIITTLDQTKLVDSGLAIAGLVTIMTTSMWAFSKMKGNATKASATMILLSGAVLLLSLALQNMIGIEWQPILMLGFIIAELIAAMAVMEGMKDMKSSAAGLLGFALSLKVVVKLVDIVGSMDPDTVEAGMKRLSIIGGALVVLMVILGQFGKDAKAMLAGTAGMLIIAVALLEMAGVIAIFGNMKAETLEQGMGAIGNSITALVFTMMALGVVDTKKALLGVAGILLLVGALALLTPIILTFAAVPFDKLKTGILGIALVMGVFIASLLLLGLTAKILAPVVPIMFLLASTILMFGAAIWLVGKGVLAFAGALLIMGTAGSAGILVLAAAIGAVIPAILIGLAQGMIEFAKIISKGAPVIAKAVVDVLTNIITLLSVEAPKLIEAIVGFLDLLLQTLLTKIPEYTIMGMEIILGFLSGIATNVPKIFEIFWQMIIDILNMLAEKIPELIKSGADIIIAFISGLTTEIPRVIETGTTMVIDFINGLAESIRTNTPLMLTAIENLCTAFIDGLLMYLGITNGTSGEAKNIAGNIIQGLVDGLTNGISSVVTAVTNVGKSLISGFKDLFNINSPSKVMEDLGGNIVDGLDEGISGANLDAVTATEDIVTKMIQVITDSIPEFKKGGNLIALAIADGVRLKVSVVTDMMKQLLFLSIRKITESLPQFNKKAFEIMDQIASGIKNTVKMAIIGDASNAIMKLILTKMSNKMPDIKDAGKAVDDNFMAGMKNEVKLKQIFDTAGVIMTNILGGMTAQAYRDKAILAGRNIGDGVIQGINNRASDIIYAGTQLAFRLIRAVEDYLGIRSPSKEFAKLGEFIDLGLINGIDNYSGLVVKSAEELGQDSIDGLKSVMSQISDAVSTEINSDPVIRPVLDLTGVQTGANALNSIMGGQTYGLAVSKLNQDRSSLANRQNGSNLFGEQGQLIKNEFNLYGVTIRSEADIDKIADQLYRKQEDAMRARGIKPAYA